MSGKKEKKSKGLKRSKQQLEMQQAALPLVNLLAAYGSQKAMGPLADKLRALPGVPYSMVGKDIKDLKKHVDLATSKSNFEVQHNLTQNIGNIFRKKPSTHAASDVSAKMKDLADLSESMLQERGLKDKVTVNLSSGLGKNYYNPIAKSVNVGTAAPSVALHEIGHAADYKNSLVKTVARRLPHLAALTAVPASYGYGDYIKEKIPGSVDDKVIDFIQKHPFATTLAGYGSSTLYPEAKASFLAWKHMKNKRSLAYANKAALRELAPAFGTYMLGAVPALAVAGVAKMLYEGSKRKPAKKKGIKKKAGLWSDTKNIYKKITTDPEAKKRFLRGFATGAGMGGLGLGGFVAYRTGTKGGKLMTDVDQEVSRDAIKRDPFISKKMEKDILRRSEKSRAWQEKHPIATTAIAGGVGALGLGTLTGIMMHDMDLMKNLKKLKR